MLRTEKKKKESNFTAQQEPPESYCHFSFTLSAEDSVKLLKMIKNSNKSRNQFLRYIAQSWIAEQEMLEAYNG